ncbi:hypothetical protein FVE85_0680 [Porphyridium purpureum]|uniref:Uncharacterized protein n=1 Tax=Porphyridium purpureum TaxID=35688 RepID=A0A5J4YZ86_PORPP|nr:hypothetical protein FVE85_0680 [Porphyridium purpureum]|eukprot:POR8371..scf208_2
MSGMRGVVPFTSWVHMRLVLLVFGFAYVGMKVQNKVEQQNYKALVGEVNPRLTQHVRRLRDEEAALDERIAVLLHKPFAYPHRNICQPAFRRKWSKWNLAQRRAVETLTEIDEVGTDGRGLEQDETAARESS